MKMRLRLKRRLRRLVAALVVFPTLSLSVTSYNSVSSGQSTSTTQNPAVSPGSPRSQSAPDEYKLSPGDVLSITVFGEPDLSAELPIGPDGYLRYPFLGKIKAAGMTIDELAEKLTKELEKQIKRPHVSITVKQYAQPPALKFYVLGAVKQPSVYKTEGLGGVDLMEAIALAGGFLEDADEKQVKVIRAGGITITADMQRLIQEGSVANAVQLLNGDVVYVPWLTGAKPIEVTVLGLISKPGTYSLSRGAKLTQLIAQAGVPLQSASDEALVVSQTTEPTRVNLKKLIEQGDISLNISLSDGDIIFVPPRETKEVIVLGRVQKPGSYPIDAPKKLLSVLAMAGGIAEGKRVSTATIYRTGEKPETIDLAQLIQQGDASLNKPVQPGDLVLVAASKTLRITVWGETRVQGTFEVEEASLLTDVLNRCGGLTDKADITNITLIRGTERRKIDLAQLITGTDLNANVEVLDGDVVIVPALERVMVVGAVKNPGLFNPPPLGLTLVEALSAAGGVDDGADLEKVKLFRDGRVDVINADALLHGGDVQAAQHRLRSGDVLVVPPKGGVYVFGAVNKAGMHIIKEDDAMMELLTYAGGPAQNANLKQATIIRPAEGKPVVLSVDIGKLLKGDISQNPKLQPGDVVVVPFAKQKPKRTFMDYVGAIGSIAWTARLLLGWNVSRW